MTNMIRADRTRIILPFVTDLRLRERTKYVRPVIGHLQVPCRNICVYRCNYIRTNISRNGFLSICYIDPRAPFIRICRITFVFLSGLSLNSSDQLAPRPVIHAVGAGTRCRRLAVCTVRLIEDGLGIRHPCRRVGFVDGDAEAEDHVVDDLQSQRVCSVVGHSLRLGFSARRSTRMIDCECPCARRE